MRKEQFINTIKGIHIKRDMIIKLKQNLYYIDQPIQPRRKIFQKAIITASVVMIVFMIPILFITIINPDTVYFDKDLSPYLETQAIIVNELDQEPIDKSFMDLIVSDDFIPMTKKELLVYYDVSIPIENALPGLKERDTGRTQGIYRSKSRGIYFDNNLFTYQSDDEQQKLIIILSKGKLPYTGLTSIVEGYDSKLEPSEVNATKVMIAYYKNINETETDNYYAEFMYNGNGYTMHVVNLSRDSFLKAIGCLLC